MSKTTLSVIALLWACGAMLPAASAEPLEIELGEVVRRVVATAPEVRQARAELGVAESRVTAARTWRTNPTVSVSGGPRFGDETLIDLMLGVELPVVPGGRPEARANVARALERVEVLRAAATERDAVAKGARAFTELLYWQHRTELAARNLALATEVEGVATRRHEVGDVGGLDPSVARLARARVEAESAHVEASRLTAEDQLRWLLGVDDQQDIVVVGDLRTVARSDPASVGRRVDVELALAAVDVAGAHQRLATRDRFPRLAIGVEGGREENATVLAGVLRLTLPVVWRGQGDLLVATASEASSREHATVVEARVAHEIRTARRRVAVLDEAVAGFADSGLSAVAKTSDIATSSYRAGAIGLSELLVVRGELVAAETEFANLLLLAAMARIELLSRSGNLIPPTHPTGRTP